MTVLRDLAGKRSAFYAQAHVHVRSLPAPHERAVDEILQALADWAELNES
jgi:shikimate kinase